MSDCRQDLLQIIKDNGLQVDDQINIHVTGDVIFLGVPLAYKDNPLFQFVESWFAPYKEDKPLFRYLSANRTISALQTGCLNACNMASQFENDFAEASEFYKRMEIYKPLVTNSNTSSGAEIEDIRDQVHILCFSKECNDYLWDKYGENKGCCLSVRITYQPNFFSRFAEVLYGADDLFDKCNLVQAMVKKKLNKVLFLPSLSYFAWLYKRRSYELEKEVRFVFRPDKLKCKIKEIPITSKWGVQNIIKSVDVPLGNNTKLPINVELVDIQYGSKIDQVKKLQIMNLARKYGL